MITLLKKKPKNNLEEKQILKLEEIINTIEIEKRYSLIYDYICDYVDTNLKENNYCDFIDGKCIASRKGKTVHEMDGCCWQRGVGHCARLSKKGVCSIKCISCKLFVCSYLESKGVRYNINKILPLKNLLNYKQKDILKRNYFKSKEEIIDKLLKAI